MADLNENKPCQSAEALVKAGYKKTKVGWIPEEWAFINFGKMVNSSAFGPRFSSDLYDEEGNVGTLRTTDMDESGNINYSGMPIAKVEIDKFQSHLLEENDLVISRSGTIGVTGLFKGFEKPVLPGAFLIRFRLKKQNTVPIYFKYFFNSTLGRRMLNRISGGGVQKNLKGSSALALKLPLPPLPEQRGIARILSTWDAAIDKLGQLIAKKQALKKGLMQQLLSGRVRFPEFVPSGGTRYKETKVGVVPEDWAVVRLGKFLVKHNEKTTVNNQYPVLTSSREGLFLQNEYYGRQIASKDNTGYNVVPRGYFTYRHMSDDLVFKFNINRLVDKGIVSTLYPVFTTISNLNSDYLFYLMNHGNAFKRFALAQKQGGSRTYMYFSKIADLRVALPSLKEQKSIATSINVMQKEIDSLHKHKDFLNRQKKGLMQQLLTGAVRVKEID